MSSLCPLCTHCAIMRPCAPSISASALHDPLKTSVEAPLTSFSSTIDAPMCEKRYRLAAFADSSSVVAYRLDQLRVSSTRTFVDPLPTVCGTQYFGRLSLRT